MCWWVRRLVFFILPLVISIGVAAQNHSILADEEVPPPPRPDRQFDEAQQQFEEGMKLLNADQAAEAIGPLEAAVTARPDDLEFRGAWSMALLRARKAGAAWHAFDPVVRGDDTDPLVFEHRLMIWQALGAVGTFNVGADAKNIVNLLGPPDREENFGQQTRWHYHFMAVNIERDQVHSVIDTRGYRPSLPETAYVMNLTFDGRPWKIGHRLVTDRQATVDYVLEGATVQQWNELISVQQLYELHLEGLSAKRWMENLKAPYADVRPPVEWEVLLEKEDRIVFFWAVPGLPEGQVQHEISAIIAGPRDLHRVTYIRRGSPITRADQLDWAERFQRISLDPPSDDRAAIDPNNQENWSRYRLWYLGRQLAAIVTLRQQDAPEDMIETLYSQLREAGTTFSVEVPPVPSASDEDGETAQQRLLLEWAIRKVAPEFTRAIAAKQSERDARLFEAAMNCHLVTEVYRPKTSSADAVRKVVERTASESGLEEPLWRPLVDALQQEEPTDSIGPLVQQLHVQAIRALESE